MRLGRLLLVGGLFRSASLAVAGAIIAADGSTSAVYALVAVESGLSVLLRPAQNSLLPGLARTPEELTLQISHFR
jgi:hypothetical protein